jgi:hypothetical protein
MDVAKEAHYVLTLLIPHKSIRMEAIIQKLIVVPLAKISSKYFESGNLKDASNCSLP